MIRSEKGLSLIEVMVVFIIVAVSATLATVSSQAGIENRQAKQVTGSLRSIAHAVKMYEMDNNTLPANLNALFQEGYLKNEELPFRDSFNYSFVPNPGSPSEWSVEATGPRQRLLSAAHQTDGSIVLSDTRTEDEVSLPQEESPHGGN